MQTSTHLMFEKSIEHKATSFRELPTICVTFFLFLFFIVIFTLIGTEISREITQIVPPSKRDIALDSACAMLCCFRGGSQRRVTSSRLSRFFAACKKLIGP